MRLIFMFLAYAYIISVVYFDYSLDTDIHLLRPSTSLDAPAEGSVSAPAVLLGKRPPGRPRKRKRGPGQYGGFVTKEQREQELLTDPRISAVEPKQVQCRMCGHWIKLCRNSDFVVTNWNTHANKCQQRTGCVYL